MIADSGARLSKRMEGEMHDKCNANWESWRAVPKEIETHLIDDDPNLMKCIDNIFKSSFREWKFDVKHVAKLNRIPEPPAALYNFIYVFLVYLVEL
ncbi:hypothetical protein D8674_020559 [Pyrus ussuriensis x Pyrus communis]|uniref:Uncharacterized protein n=1 Tax=Pyrus ussuriensis x Pyrus communis TaxID=2448454 RepID=A0A5N5HL41_9ROSA|nr:hypothetical protein D8674_020559 [Pyrus ussuriensis x Pyrus communis]